MCFVAVSEKALSKQELIELLESLSTSPSYYFLRWKHRVGGFWKRRKDEYKNLENDICDRLTKNPLSSIHQAAPTEAFPSPEGQLFNSILEIRWKQKQGEYQVLILSSQKQAIEINFKPIEYNWEVLEENVLVYASRETRFPKTLNQEKLNIAQRYFRDKNTATTHFVALTVREKNA